MVADDLTAGPHAFRQAVAARQAYQPLYVKIKLFFRCNLKCEMGNHWRSTREPPLTIPCFQEILNELSALGLRTRMTTNGKPGGQGVRQAAGGGRSARDQYLHRSPLRKVHDAVRGVDGAWKKAFKSRM